MADAVRVLALNGEAGIDPADPPEWLVGNGLGGFASGTVTGIITRRYHGLLIAALPVPLGRTVMLDGIAETVVLAEGRRVRLGADQVSEQDAVADAGALEEFRLELGLPVWRFGFDGIIVERRLVLLHAQNTAQLSWRLVEGADSLRLRLRPFVHVRPLEGRVSDFSGRAYKVISQGDRHEISAGDDLPTLKLHLSGPDKYLVLDGGERREIFYAWESRRGYDCRGGVWSPGRFGVLLTPDRDVVLIISTEPWEAVTALRPVEAAKEERARRRALIDAAEPALREGPAAELVLAADSFIVTPPRREPPRAILAGDGLFRTVIAGYHWFTDWGRDTMISLEGLTLVTGRHAEARGILRNFAAHVRDGLIPNLFPEHESEGVYNTADATLWFFHALDRYLEATGDRDLLRDMLPKLVDIVHHHITGTRFGIGIDPADGLLRQGEEGYQLTWMDAKVDGWVVTPRRGKAVEINALWYNALRLLATWMSEEDGDADLPLAAMAQQVFVSFNARFWSAGLGHLYDIVDGEQGDDPSLRPNQVLAISLRHPVLDSSRWKPVLDAVERHLLTPVGLRSLAPGHPDYQPRYWGDLRARDAAYHQGTVWGWLIGPFIDAWLKIHPGEPAAAARFFEGFWAHLDHGCIGSISEIFDAEAPFAPRGCIAQAWSVAEILRCRRRCAG